jgi:predicted O-methyltransferase YrrM
MRNGLPYKITSEFAIELYQFTLGRDPTDYEIAEAHYLAENRGVRAFLFALCSKKQDAPYRTGETRALFVPPGHYYSPIVDPGELLTSGFSKNQDVKVSSELSIDPKKMLSLFHSLAAYFPLIKLPQKEQESHRYYAENDFFCYGDAIILSAIIRHFRPQKIIEIGSGFSSAALLDTLDAAKLTETQCTFIEPYPERLHGLLRLSDRARVQIIESPIQRVEIDKFRALRRNDILFIDSTHVTKTGSDVNHEVFQIIPALQAGVIIHFHDIFWPFEYPAAWIDDSRSWNELYLLRAFLMHNERYEILYFNHLIHSAFSPEVSRIDELICQNPGGGLWLRKN